MGKSCCAVGCMNRCYRGCGLEFYRFPRDSERRRQWIAAVDRKNWVPSEFSWICSGHFVGGKKSNDLNSPAYTPSIFCHVKSLKKRKAAEDLCRYHRLRVTKRRRMEGFKRERVATKRQRKSEGEVEGILSEEERSETVEEVSHVQKNCSSCSTMTELSLDDLITAEQVASEKYAEISRLKDESVLLRKQISSLKEAMITQESLKDSDAKVKYYTGLPSYGVLKAVFDFVYPCVKNYSRTVLPLFDQFLMVLLQVHPVHGHIPIQ